MELKKLMVDSKSAWINFPGLEGFEIEVVNLSRKELTGIRKRCTTNKFDRKTRQLTESLDEEKFVEEFADKSIKNWKGLKLEFLETLLLVDTGDEDLNRELEYSKDNAETLVTNSNEFDTWLNEVVFDLDNFRRKSERKDNRKTGKTVPKS
jgi:hypothetical protein